MRVSDLQAMVRAVYESCRPLAWEHPEVLIGQGTADTFNSLLEETKNYLDRFKKGNLNPIVQKMTSLNAADCHFKDLLPKLAVLNAVLNPSAREEASLVR